MRFSEARLRGLAKKIAAEMTARGVVRAKSGTEGLAGVIVKLFEDDARREELLEAEARELLRKQRTLPPEGTPEFQAALGQTKRLLATRKGIVL